MSYMGFGEKKKEIFFPADFKKEKQFVYQLNTFP